MRATRMGAVFATVAALSIGAIAPAQAATAPVNPYAAAFTTTATGYEEGYTAPVKTASIAERVGTCSGSYRTIWRTQYINNTYGIHLAHVTLSTTFYWNGSRVTCSYSSRTPVIDSYGAQGNWEFKGWTDWGEVFYAYTSAANTGIKTWSSGWFKGCNNFAGVPLCSTGTVTNRTYGHYNGTWSTGGYTG